MIRLPEKYQTAYELLDAKKEDEFLAHDAKNTLDYNITGFGDLSRSDDTLLLTACNRNLWKAAERIVEKGSTIGWKALSKTYGYAPNDLSELVWSQFAKESDNKFDVSVARKRDDHFPTHLVVACVHRRCHVKLLQKLIGTGIMPDQYYREHGARYSMASALLHINRPRCLWNPTAFIWLCETYTKEQLKLDDDDIDRVIKDWKFGYFVSTLDDDDDDSTKDYWYTPDEAEQVFWLLEKMYSDPVKFRELVSELVPSDANTRSGSLRLVKMLAACGVVSKEPAMIEASKDVAAMVACLHCNGTGKVVGVDEELVRQAKKRRLDAVKK